MNPTTHPAATPPVISLGGRSFTVLFIDLTRPLNDVERRALRESLLEFGILFPVLIDDADNVLDGANRLALAAELGWGLDRVPLKVVGTRDLPRDRDAPLPADAPLSTEQKRIIAVDANLARRQLSPTDQRALRRIRIRRVAELRQEGLSSHDIADAVGVSQPQVLRDLQAIDTPVSMPQRIQTSDGRTYPARRAARAEADTEAVEERHPAPAAEPEPEGDAEPEERAELEAGDAPADPPAAALDPAPEPLPAAPDAAGGIKPVTWKTGPQKERLRQSLRRRLAELWARYGVLFAAASKTHGLVRQLLRLIRPGRPRREATDAPGPPGDGPPGSTDSGTA